MPTPSLLTVKQFADKHRAFSEASLRALIFAAKDRKTSNGVIPSNGMDIALVRIGSKVLIDEDAFFDWLGQSQCN